MTTKRPKRWNFSGEIKDYLDRLIATKPNWNATNIHKSLEKDMGHLPDLPVLRTVQSYVAYSRPPDPSGEWHPTDPEWSGDDAWLVLEALSEARTFAREILPWPTRAEAERILWMRKAGLPGILGYGVARFYTMREARQESTRDLDWFIAFRPWGSDAEQAIYSDVMGNPELEQGLWYLLDMHRRIEKEFEEVRNERKQRELMGNQNIKAEEIKEEANV